VILDIPETDEIACYNDQRQRATSSSHYSQLQTSDKMQLRHRTIPDPAAADKQAGSMNVDGHADEGGEEEFEVVDAHDEDTAALLSGDDLPEVKVKRRQNGIAGDERNIAVLLFLYVLQGIPLGLAAAVPLILTNRNVSYKQQAEFSFAYWPFSIKLLWAPIVDSVFVAKFGRRKTWLVPVQYLIGATMLLLAQNVDFYLGHEDNNSGKGNEPNVFILTCLFFFLNFLAATQDIAVDGWALTMLQRHNVGYASTCNAVGQTAGYFLGYVGYMGLESYKLITLSGFLFFWGCVFIVATTLVAIFKSEKDTSKSSDNPNSEEEEEEQEEEEDLGIVDTYKMLYKIVTLPLMPAFVVFLLTSKVGFSAADSVTSLKLIERGVPKEKLAMLAIPIIPLNIALPWIISKYTSGTQPMNIYLKAIPPRLIMGLVFMGVVMVTPSLALEDGSFPVYYYGLIMAVFIVHQVFLNCMFVSIMAFFAKISDPAVGGTYMTLLNTLTNLGGNWPATLALWWVDVLTVKQCDLSAAVNSGNFTAEQTAGNMCQNAEKTKQCVEEFGGKCVTETEGYYIESVVCVAVGLLWLGLWGWRTMMRLQSADEAAWRVIKKSKASSD